MEIYDNIFIMKKLLLLLTFAATLVGCNSTTQQTPEKTAVDRVYAIDSQICGNSGSIAEVASKAQSVDLTGTPANFASAYKANTKAWLALADIEKQMYAANITKAQSDVKTFLSDYTSNPTKASVFIQNAWPQFSNQIAAALTKIVSTKADYTSIGASYGSVYPKTSSWFSF